VFEDGSKKLIVDQDPAIAKVMERWQRVAS